MNRSPSWHDVRICIPIPHRRRGGLYTFLHTWRQWLDANGIFHTEDPGAEYDVFFVNSFMVPYRQVLEIKKSRFQVCIVQRVDGSADDYGRYGIGDAVQARVNTLADLTIFQSRYSVASTREKYRVIAQQGPIIYNPVDTETFTPHGPRASLGSGVTVCNASYSINLKKGTWQIGDLAAAHPDVVFVLCGRYPPLPERPNIQQRGLLGRAELAQVMRACDVFLHLALNDPCPNVVLEALASGLPVLYVNGGGTPELVGEAGLPIEIGSFRQQLDRIMAERPKWAQLARARAEAHFAPDIVLPQYMQAIARCQPKPIPSFKQVLKMRLAGYPVLPIERRYVQAFLRKKPKQLYRRFAWRVAR